MIEELVWEPRVDVAEIVVSVESGIVILNGAVRGPPEKWAAGSPLFRVVSIKLGSFVLGANMRRKLFVTFAFVVLYHLF